MLSLPLANTTGEPLNVLCLGAHCDDIEIGCGGSLLALQEKYEALNIFWQVFTSTPERAEEARLGAERFCERAANLQIQILEFRDGYLPYHGEAVKEAFEAIKPAFRPDVIFTHNRRDAHQDHRLIGELTWNTFRNHQILEYEIPKWDGDLGQPNCFIDLNENQAQKKIQILQEVYNSQKSKHWFTDDLFHGLMRLRGMESNSPSMLAEAFYAHKIKLL